MNMPYWFNEQSGEPLFWVKNRPVYLTGLIIIIHCFTFIIGVFAAAFDFSSWFVELSFNTRSVLLHTKIWQLFTYPWIHTPSLAFALDMLVLYWFGHDVEHAVGRLKYLLLYFSLIFLPAVLSLGLAAINPTLSGIMNGSDLIHFSLFIAFTCLFPSSELFLGIRAKWVAIIFLALFSLIDIASRSWMHLFWCWCSVAIAAYSIYGKNISHFLSPARLKIPIRKPQKSKEQESASLFKKKTEGDEAIDAILDKIAKKGMSSLTKSERAALEKARIALLRKDQKK
ncbi:rhomboid family intramembrane serine protease [Methylacidiphilum caldifontis]|uniref:Rhomboid family intramembrane serine protease n=1 Tax=Methylacidiphilum caldifontis TaxID=2795386 RepID=A0A4Y8PGP7_9BACT|nr:rhomboid family intramembrane serine protease [Methylacidiphilum caldifontis]QSR88770.1 rhomboid family intramembrane serine protease [Methylacidiphilum caldifontis]TFE71536.1 rhomboid family intramembrane serine protease [Methylacidiphilum caldifontis]